MLKVFLSTKQPENSRSSKNMIPFFMSMSVTSHKYIYIYIYIYIYMRLLR